MKVYNKKDADCPKDAVYIGRPSIWGNPYAIGVDGTREEVLAKYKAYVENSPWLVDYARKELQGKNLCCWCKPESCHGDILIEIVNS